MVYDKITLLFDLLAVMNMVTSNQLFVHGLRTLYLNYKSLM